MKSVLAAFFLAVLVERSFADQRSTSAALERATNAFNQGKLGEAEKQVDSAEKMDSKKPAISNLRGAIFTREKRYDEAVQQFNQALALDPKFYPARFNLAEVRLLTGNYDEATKEYQALKEVDPGSELVDFKLVLCMVLAGDLSKASEMVDLMKFPGKTPAYYYARAAIALKRGEKDAAQKYFDNVKKYYSEGECRYFVESLKELDFASPTPVQPAKTPNQHPVKSDNPDAGSD